MISHTYAKNILNALFKTKGTAGMTPEQELSSFNLTPFTVELRQDDGTYATETVYGIKYDEYYNAYVTDGYRERNATKALNDKKNKVTNSQWYQVVSLTSVHYKSYTVKVVDSMGNPVKDEATGKEKTTEKTFTSWYAKKIDRQKVPYPTKTFLALFTTMPDLDGGNYEEPGDETTYIRVDLKSDIIAGQAVLGRAESKDGIPTVQNSKIIMYPEIDQNAWGTIKGFGIFETQEKGAGRPIIWGPLKDASGAITEVVTQSNYVPLFRKEQFKITLS